MEARHPGSGRPLLPEADRLMVIALDHPARGVHSASVDIVPVHEPSDDERADRRNADCGQPVGHGSPAKRQPCACRITAWTATTPASTRTTTANTAARTRHTLSTRLARGHQAVFAYRPASAPAWPASAPYQRWVCRSSRCGPARSGGESPRSAPFPRLARPEHHRSALPSSSPCPGTRSIPRRPVRAEERRGIESHIESAWTPRNTRAAT
jgi:hypothetical protein